MVLVPGDLPVPQQNVARKLGLPDEAGREGVADVEIASVRAPGARLRESCAMGKLYWMVPPVFELSSIDFA